MAKNKYLKPIYGIPVDSDTDALRVPVLVDVYDIIEACDVHCQAIQHALKKLLFAGLRGKGDRAQDLREAIQAVERGIELDAVRGLKAATPWAAYKDLNVQKESAKDEGVTVSGGPGTPPSVNPISNYQGPHPGPHPGF